LQACLRSLLDQELGGLNSQIVVCDDGSEPPLQLDDAVTVNADGGDGRDGGHDSKHVELVRQPPRGPAAARNQGARRASANLIAFVDSDVELDASCLRELVLALQRNANWRGAEAALLPTGGEAGLLSEAPRNLDGGTYHTAAIVYRRCAFVDAGGFDEAFPYPASEDVELAARILQQGAIGFVPEAIAYHPRRAVTAATHWDWRKHWFFTAVVARRYGFLAFPGTDAGVFPRARVGLAAVFTLPLGRFKAAMGAVLREPAVACRAAAYALLDVFVGLAALPGVLFGAIPPRRNYLQDMARESVCDKET
jgi:GT2 family glycosyltransferase